MCTQKTFPNGSHSQSIFSERHDGNRRSWHLKNIRRIESAFTPRSRQDLLSCGIENGEAIWHLARLRRCVNCMNANTRSCNEERTSHTNRSSLRNLCHTETEDVRFAHQNGKRRARLPGHRQVFEECSNACRRWLLHISMRLHIIMTCDENSEIHKLSLHSLCHNESTSVCDCTYHIR
ncbi:hypothetical protein BaRGS_00020933 [Batillaria attramentaria]|uniref:Uncharacterized protein n=1 Tax=Batillaria attramentaria TaxID=370345 RepID=A0ABD0KKX0_9CAEN